MSLSKARRIPVHNPVGQPATNEPRESGPPKPRPSGVLSTRRCKSLPRPPAFAGRQDLAVRGVAKEWSGSPLQWTILTRGIGFVRFLPDGGNVLYYRDNLSVLIAMLELKAYFDESGTDAQSKVVVVAGYLTPKADWAAIETDWRKVLDGEGAAYYHATDAEAVRPQGIYKGWTKKKARGLTDRVAAIASSSVMLKGVGIHITADDWLAAADLVRPFFTPDDLRRFPKKPFEVPYQILVRSCIEVVMENLNPNLAASETAAFVFEDNDWKEPTLAGYDVLRRIHLRRERFGTIAFEEKKKLAGLQAADLLAWQYRRVTAMRKGYAKGSIHRSLGSLVKPDFAFRQLTKDQLEQRLKEAMKLIFSGKV
jgi:hypothetical protein